MKKEEDVIYQFLGATIICGVECKALQPSISSLWTSSLALLCCDKSLGFAFSSHVHASYGHGCCFHIVCICKQEMRVAS